MNFAELDKISRIDLKPPQALKPFVDISKRVSRAVVDEFRDIRSDAELVNPPILILSEDAVKEQIKPGVVERFREKFANFGYDPVANAIVGSNLELQELLAKGVLGRRKITLIMAEELIHAQSTSKIGSKLRVGYGVIEIERTSHGLIPGAIYDTSASSLPPQNQETKTISAPKYQRDSLLTERVTQIVIHGMMERLVPGVFIEMPVLALGQEKKFIKFGNKSEIFEAAKRSLYTGNKDLLAKNGFPKDLLEMLRNDAPITIVTMPNGSTRVEDTIGRGM